MRAPVNVRCWARSRRDLSRPRLPVLTPEGDVAYLAVPVGCSIGFDVLGWRAKTCLWAWGRDMERRTFIAALATAAVWPLGARAQQSPPVIGFLHRGALPPPALRAAFRKGLVEAGISEGQSITIEDRAAISTSATVCFSRLELTLHGSPALCLAADVVVLPLHTRHRHRQHATTCLQRYP